MQTKSINRGGGLTALALKESGRHAAEKYKITIKTDTEIQWVD